MRWRKIALEDTIFEALKVQVEIVQEETVCAKSTAQKEDDKTQCQLSLLQAQYDACSREKLEQYEAYREGRITDELFLSKRDHLTSRQTELKEQMAECERQREDRRQAMETAEERHQAVGRMTGLSDTQLRERLYDAVERVLVYDAGSIEIIWKFQDTTIIVS